MKNIRSSWLWWQQDIPKWLGQRHVYLCVAFPPSSNDSLGPAAGPLGEECCSILVWYKILVAQQSWVFFVPGVSWCAKCFQLLKALEEVAIPAAFPSCHWARSWIHPGQVGSPSQKQIIQTIMHTHPDCMMELQPAFVEGTANCVHRQWFLEALPSSCSNFQTSQNLDDIMYRMMGH